MVWFRIGKLKLSGLGGGLEGVYVQCARLVRLPLVWLCNDQRRRVGGNSSCKFKKSFSLHQDCRIKKS